MSDELDQLSDAALSERFAVEVAGIWPENYSPELHGIFATSADAVLPMLRNYEYVDVSREHEDPPREWCVVLSVTRESRPIYFGQAPTFARAACIALLRAKRAEKATP